jgi:hypothetical protein
MAGYGCHVAFKCRNRTLEGAVFTGPGNVFRASAGSVGWG